jgi:hypothetical protein
LGVWVSLYLVLGQLFVEVFALFEKILVPLDGSEQSLRALDVAVEIATKFGGKLTLIHAYSVAGVMAYLPEHDGRCSCDECIGHFEVGRVGA